MVKSIIKNRMIYLVTFNHGWDLSMLVVGLFSQSGEGKTHEVLVVCTHHRFHVNHYIRHGLWIIVMMGRSDKRMQWYCLFSLCE